MDHGKPTTGRRVKSSVMTAVATVMAGGPPPSGGLSREALTWWFDGTSVKGQGRLDLMLLGVTGDGFL
jgi:hypothetical protein